MDSSTRLPPVTTVLATDQTFNEALTALLPACAATESVTVLGVDVSSAVPPDLSGIVPGNFDLDLEPHGGEAGTSPPANEDADPEECQKIGN